MPGLVGELLGEEEELPPHLAVFAGLQEALEQIPKHLREERARQIIAGLRAMHDIAEDMRRKKY